MAPLYRIITSWTVPYALNCASTACRYSSVDLHAITLLNFVDWSVVCECGNCMINIMTDFSRRAEFSRNFGLKVSCFVTLNY